MDNLNTHVISSLYETFPPQEAFRLAERHEMQRAYGPNTPKQGSRLNIAEIELSAMTAQCLGGRRIPDIAALNEELAACLPGVMSLRRAEPCGILSVGLYRNGGSFERKFIKTSGLIPNTPMPRFLSAAAEAYLRYGGVLNQTFESITERG
jgi:hypothetical protein